MVVKEAMDRWIDGAIARKSSPGGAFLSYFGPLGVPTGEHFSDFSLPGPPQGGLGGRLRDFVVPWAPRGSIWEAWWAHFGHILEPFWEHSGAKNRYFF